jgi:hypothetical protein
MASKQRQLAPAQALCSNENKGEKQRGVFQKSKETTQRDSQGKTSFRLPFVHSSFFPFPPVPGLGQAAGA